MTADTLTLPGLYEAGKDNRIDVAFAAYHGRHPEVYKALCRNARVLIRRGTFHYSIDALLHVVRFHMDIGRDENETFKINNNYSSHYARLIMRQEPDLVGFFETRELRAK